jgi:hypothetical protein
MIGHVSNVVSAVLIFMVRVYQVAISPYLGNHCRFYPSCSRYAILAIHKDGAIKGTFKAVLRILRCNPFTTGGIDYP